MHTVKALPSVQKKIEYKDQLPSRIRGMVDKTFGQWKFPEYHDDCETDGPPFFKCNLNGDSLPDYALDITVGGDSSLHELFIAFVSNDSGYSLFILDTVSRGWTGNCYLKIFHAGMEFDGPPFYQEGDNRKSFDTDCVSQFMCSANGCTVFLYEKGRFRRFSPCD
jgi:hypothetical protein